MRFLITIDWHPDYVTGNSFYRGHWPGVAIVSTPGTQFELTRPDSLYDDLTKMSKYMPQLEQHSPPATGLTVSHSPTPSARIS